MNKIISEFDTLNLIKRIKFDSCIIIFITKDSNIEIYKNLVDKLSKIQYNSLDLNIIKRDISINEILLDDFTHNGYIIISEPTIYKKGFIRHLIPNDETLILPTIGYNSINNRECIRGGNSILYEADLAIKITDYGLFKIIKNRFGDVYI